MKTFFSELFDLAKRHPLSFLFFLALVVMFLGGIVWKGISLVLGLIRKVPGGSAVAGAIEGASAKTGS